MPLTSYWVLSGHKYIGPTSVRSVPKIKAEEHKSMEFEAPTVGSYGHANTSQIFTKYGVVTRTSNKRFVTSYQDFSANGYFSQQDDYEIQGMKMAGEDNPSARHNLIATTPRVAYIQGITPTKLKMPNVRDTSVDLYTTSEINIVPINEVGKNVSTTHGIVYEGLKNLVWDKDKLDYQMETVTRMELLSSKGLKPIRGEAPVLGYGIEYDDSFFAAYYPEQRYLVTNANFHGKVRDAASKYGLTEPQEVRAMRRSFLDHEVIRHGTFGIKGDRASERLQGLIDAEFYSMLAGMYKGTKWEKVYRALAREGKDYARDFSLLSSLWDEITEEPHTQETPFDRLVKKLEAEADVFGISGGKKTAYVNSRLKHTYGDLLGSEASYRGKNRISKSSKSRDNTSNSGDESLEDKIEAEIDSREIGKNGSPSYKRGLDESDYKSMKDVAEREEKSEKAEAKAEAQEAQEAPSG